MYKIILNDDEDLQLTSIRTLSNGCEVQTIMILETKDEIEKRVECGKEKEWFKRGQKS